MIGFIVYKHNNAGEKRFLDVVSSISGSEQPVWRFDAKDATIFMSKDSANIFMTKRSIEPDWSLRQIYISETEIQQYKIYEDVASMHPHSGLFISANRKYDLQMLEHQLRVQEVMNNNMNQKKLPGIKKVIFNDPATIVMWNDGTKTIVKYDEKTKSGKKKKAFDPEKGLAMAIAKKALGNEGNYYETFKKWLPKEDK